MPRLDSHFRASVKTARIKFVRRDASEDNFWSHCRLDLRLKKPFYACIAQKFRKFQPKPFIGSKVILEGIVVGSVIKQLVAVARKGSAILKQSELL